MRYGLPYKGSKNGIAEWVVERLPKAAHFYDLFAGGCAVTHAAMLSGKYETYTASDITDSAKLFGDAIAGKYRNETRWISHEDFFRLKDTDPYVRICWSFGNDQKSYLYSKEIEPWKKALHYGLLLNDWSQFEKLCPEVAAECKERAGKAATVKERYVAVKAVIKEFLKRNNRDEVFRNNPLYNACRVRTVNKTRALGAIDTSCLLQSLGSLEGLQRLQSLESLERLEILQGDYQAVDIKPHSVIYCDIPYQGTTGYLGVFDYERFFDWCGRQRELVVISEYNMPKDRFLCVAAKEKRVTYSATNNNGRKIERLFIPAHQKELYESMRPKENLFDFPQYEMG